MRTCSSLEAFFMTELGGFFFGHSNSLGNHRLVDDLALSLSNL